MKKGIYIKNKKRLITIILFLVLMNLGIKTISLPPEDLYETINVVENDELEYINVYVKSGDTIWNIVEKNYDKIEKPQYLDIRDVVYMVIEINGTSNLSIGDVVKIPAEIN